MAELDEENLAFDYNFRLILVRRLSFAGSPNENE